MYLLILIYIVGFFATWILLGQVEKPGRLGHIRQLSAAVMWPAYWLIMHNQQDIRSSDPSDWEKPGSGSHWLVRTICSVPSATLRILTAVLLLFMLILIAPFAWLEKKRSPASRLSWMAPPETGDQEPHLTAQTPVWDILERSRAAAE